MNRADATGGVAAADVTPYPFEKSFFDVCPTTFFDQVYNMCDDIIANAIDALDEQLSSEFKSEESLVRHGLNRMQTKMQACFDTNIDKFEMYAVCNIFHVPPTVYGAWCAKQLAAKVATTSSLSSSSSSRAGADSVSVAIASGSFEGPASEQDMLVADEELRSARRRLRAAKRKQATLAAREAALKESLDTLNSGVATAEEAFKPLASTLTKSVSQLVSKQGELVELCAEARRLLDSPEVNAYAPAGYSPSSSSSSSSASSAASSSTSFATAASNAATPRTAMNSSKRGVNTGRGGAADLRSLTSRIGN
jgi:hypothetical protein